MKREFHISDGFCWKFKDEVWELVIGEVTREALKEILSENLLTRLTSFIHDTPILSSINRCKLKTKCFRERTNISVLIAEANCTSEDRACH